jgi:hypothetical protein
MHSNKSTLNDELIEKRIVGLFSFLKYPPAWHFTDKTERFRSSSSLIIFSCLSSPFFSSSSAAGKRNL